MYVYIHESEGIVQGSRISESAALSTCTAKGSEAGVGVFLACGLRADQVGLRCLCWQIYPEQYTGDRLPPTMQQHNRIATLTRRLRMLGYEKTDFSSSSLWGSTPYRRASPSTMQTLLMMSDRGSIEYAYSCQPSQA